MLKNINSNIGSSKFKPMVSEPPEVKRAFLKDVLDKTNPFKSRCFVTCTDLTLGNCYEWKPEGKDARRINFFELQCQRISNLTDLSQKDIDTYWQDGAPQLTPEELNELNENLDRGVYQSSMSISRSDLKKSSVLLKEVNKILGFNIQDKSTAPRYIDADKLKRLFIYLATLKPAEISSLVTDENGLLCPLLKGGVDTLKVFASFMCEADFHASLQELDVYGLKEKTPNLIDIILLGVLRNDVTASLLKIAHNKKFRLSMSRDFNEDCHHAFSLAFIAQFGKGDVSQTKHNHSDFTNILEDLCHASPEVVDELFYHGNQPMHLIRHCIDMEYVKGATFLLNHGVMRNKQYNCGEVTLCALWKPVVALKENMRMLELFFDKDSLETYIVEAENEASDNPFWYVNSPEKVRFLAHRFGEFHTKALLKTASFSLYSTLKKSYRDDCLNQQESDLNHQSRDTEILNSFPTLCALFENSDLCLDELDSYPDIIEPVVCGVIFSLDDERRFKQCPIEIQKDYFREAIKRGCYKIVRSIVNDESRCSVIVESSYDSIYDSISYRRYGLLRVLLGTLTERFGEEIQERAENGSLLNDEQSGTILHLIAIHSDTSSLDFIQNKLKAQLGDEEVKDLFKKLANIPNQDGKLAEDVALLSEIRCLFKTWRTGENTGPAVEDTQFSLGRFQECLEEFKATIRQIETLFCSHYDENAPRQQAELYNPDMVCSVMTDVYFKNFIKKGKALKKAWDDLSPDLQNQLSWNTNGLDAHVDQASITVFKHLHEKLPICVSSYRGLRSSPHYLRHDVMMQDSEAIRRIHEYGVSASSKFMTKGMFDIAGIYYNIWNEIWKQSEAQGPMEEKGRYVKDHEHLGMEGVVFYKGEMRSDGSYEIWSDYQPTHIRFVVTKGKKQQDITLITFFPIRRAQFQFRTFTKVSDS